MTTLHYGHFTSWALYIMGILHYGHFTLWAFYIMGTLHHAEFPSDKICIENQTHILCQITFLPKIVSS